MKEQLQALEQEALSKVEEASTIKELQDVRVAYLGKKGPITEVLRGMGKLSPEERPIIGGELANTVRANIANAMEEKKDAMERAELEKQLAEEQIDVTLPGRPVAVGGPTC